MSKPVFTITLNGVREYTEEHPVNLIRHENGRIVIRATTDSGWISTEVDLLDLITWLDTLDPDQLSNLQHFPEPPQFPTLGPTVGNSPFFLNAKPD